MRAKDVMTGKVYAARVETPVAKIAQTMAARRISGVPVVDRQRRILGIVSEGDLLHRIEAGTVRHPSWWARLLAEPDSRARDYVKSRGRFARDVMTREVISVTEDTDVSEVATLMEHWGIKRVPVVRSGKLVGIISRRDLVRAVGQTMPARRRRRLKDVDLRDRLRRKIDAAPWLGSALVNFVVRKGKVELSGLVASDAQRDAVRVMAETIGATAVKDKLAIFPRGLAGSAV